MVDTRIGVIRFVMEEKKSVTSRLIGPRVCIFEVAIRARWSIFIEAED